MVETGGLENRCTGNRTGGSNPSPSASLVRGASPPGRIGLDFERRIKTSTLLHVLHVGLGSSVLVALLMASPLMARDQIPPARPDFSGHWRVDESLSQLEGAGGWFGNDCQISQTAKDITFASGGSGPGTGRSTYATDGTELKQQLAFGTRVDKAIWNGDRLIITIINNDAATGTAPARTTTRTATVFLDRNGLLVVDVIQSPPSAGHFAIHSVYRRQ